MSDLSPTLGFRTKKGTFAGPFLNEGQLANLLRLCRDQVSPAGTTFPDLSPVICSLHKLIQDGFDDQARLLQGYMLQQQLLEQERQLAKSYEMLFGKWSYASSIIDEKKKEYQWDKVVDQACDVLYDLREAMPVEKSTGKWNDDLARRVQQIGFMYTEALLFIIYGRASYEPMSLIYDTRPRKYLREMKAIIASYFDGDNKKNLLMSAALHKAENYKMVCELSGFNTQIEADAFLFRTIKAITPDLVPDPNALMTIFIDTDEQETYSRTVRSEQYSSRQWMVVCDLWKLHQRLGLLESLLDALEEDNSGNKNSGDTSEILDAVLEGRVTLLSR